MENEIWKTVGGYEGIYEVSPLGKVRNIKKAFILSIFYGNKYCNVKLIAKRHLMHRLVAAAFIPNPNNLPEVNHIDGNKENNHVNNLEWCTRSENMKHAFRIGKISLAGMNSRSRKLNESQVLEIYSSKEKGVYLAQKFNVTSANITDIQKGKIWSTVTNSIKGIV